MYVYNNFGDAPASFICYCEICAPQRGQYRSTVADPDLQIGGAGRGGEVSNKIFYGLLSLSLV